MSSFTPAINLATNKAIIIDTEAPSIVTFTPPDEGTALIAQTPLYLKFTEPVIKGTGNIEIRLSSNNSLHETIDITSALVTGWSSTTLAVNPSIALNSLESYYINISIGAITDLALNNYAGILNATTWNFTSGDFTLPVILSVSSTTPNGTYGTGTVIPITLTFSENVTSTGLVTVTLETGDIDRTCTFTILDSSTRTCNYTVQRGDSTLDLTVKSISGIIKDQTNNSMINFEPVTILEFTSDIVIETIAPAITNITSDKSNGQYKQGEVIDIDLTFSVPVTSTGDVTVTLETGTVDRTCTFQVTNSITASCNYTVEAQDTTSDLTVKTISGTIKDQANVSMTDFTPEINLADNKAIVIDTEAPETPIASPQGATYSTTQSVTLSSVGSNAIYYTEDSTVPTTSSTLYSGAITISITTTLKAISVDVAGNQSSVMTEVYTSSVILPPHGSVTHLECNNQKCISVSGEGSNLCTQDLDCNLPAHTECDITNKCILVMTPGDSYCQTDAECLVCSPKGDINKNGRIDVTDFSILLYYWKQLNPKNPCADINKDNVVNVTDFSIMLYWWTK